MPVTKAIGPGDDVDAWCTRCKMNLNHRIIAIVGRDIKRVHCLTCGSDHKYYPPRNADGTTSSKSGTVVSRSAKARTSPARAAKRSEGEWTVFMKEMSPDTVPRTYSVFEAFEAGEFVEHPQFGVGKVLEVTGRERIDAIFKEGRKTLICNRKR